MRAPGFTFSLRVRIHANVSTNRARSPAVERRRTVLGQNGGHETQPRSELGSEIGSLTPSRDPILAALDFLLTGF
jgi:hypothetical protein